MIFTRKEADTFVENLAMLISSNMQVGDALASLGEEIHSKRMRKLAAQLEEEVKSGSTLSQALERAKAFQDRYIALVRLGEQTGTLSENLKLILENQRKERILKSKLRNALAYPAAVMIVTFGAALVTIWYTFPRLAEVFAEMGGTIPVTTQVILHIGQFLKSYGFVVIPGFIVLVIVLLFTLFIWKKTKRSGEMIIFSLPFARGIVQEIELARMGHALGSLVAAGMDFPQALNYLKDSTPLYYYRGLYAAMGKDVLDGVPLSQSIKTYKGYKMLMPSHVIQLISMGERTGKLSSTLLLIGETYEEKSDSATKSLGAVLEPAIIIIVGLAVGIVAVGIITPIYELIGNIGQ